MVDHPTVVVNIEKDAILGMDFVNAQKCTLHLNKSVLRIGDTNLNMWNEYSAGTNCCKNYGRKKTRGLSWKNTP